MKMNTMELIRTRRSVRSFDRKPISPEEREKLLSFTETIQNPYGIPVSFRLLEAEAHGLSSPVLKGDTLYIAATVPDAPHSEEAFGYSFEEMVLYAWSLGIGTTWIAGTLNRKLFEKEAGVREGERMYCVSPLGYPAKKMSVKEIAMRRGIKADERLPAHRLFFDGSFEAPLGDAEEPVAAALEAVRLAPSAVNRQPWRILRMGNAFHFYLKHDKGYADAPGGDIQKIDMGIALCHFMRMAGGALLTADPGLPTPADTEYIATVLL